MKTFTIAAIFALLCVPAASARAGDLRLTIANGRVTIIAQDVPLRQILDEWGRVGGTKVVGAERLTGPAISLELHDVPEGRALETLLRSASGYIAKPRSGTVGASAYDRILIMAASTPPAGGRSARAAGLQQPAAASGRHAQCRRGRRRTHAEWHHAAWAPFRRSSSSSRAHRRRR